MAAGSGIAQRCDHPMQGDIFLNGVL